MDRSISIGCVSWACRAQSGAWGRRPPGGSRQPHSLAAVTDRTCLDPRTPRSGVGRLDTRDSSQNRTNHASAGRRRLAWNRSWGVANGGASVQQTWLRDRRTSPSCVVTGSHRHRRGPAAVASARHRDPRQCGSDRATGARHPHSSRTHHQLGSRRFRARAECPGRVVVTGQMMCAAHSGSSHLPPSRVQGLPIVTMPPPSPRLIHVGRSRGSAGRAPGRCTRRWRAA